MSATGSAAVATPAKGTKRIKASLLLDTFGLSPDAMSPLERRTAISGYDLRHRIEALVAGVTAKRIKHVYRGDGAATAPGLMILPRIVATSLFPLRHVRILLGYTAHEAAHQLETDFGLLNALIDDPTREMRRKRQVKEFWNAIEDYRIEKRTRRTHPGFHHYINDTRDFSAARFCERVAAGVFKAEDLSNPYRMGAVGLTWIGAELNGYSTTAPRAALNLLDPVLLAWLEHWRSDIAKVETCAEAQALAERIVEDMEKQNQDQDDQDQNQDPSAESKQGGDGSGQAGDRGGGKGGGSDQADGQSGSKAGQEDERSPAKDKDGETQADANGDGDSDADGSGGDAADADGKGDAEADASGDAQDGSGGANGGADTGDPSGQSQDGKGGEGDDAAQEDASDQQGAGQSDADGDGADAGDADGPCDAGRGSESADPSAGGSQAPRLKFRPGDEDEDCEAADLQIEELAEAINSMKGDEARDPAVRDEADLAASGECDADARREAVARGQAKYAQIRREVGAPAARAAGILRRLLQSTARRSWQGGMEEGDLDFGRIVPMTQGAPDVYRQRQQRQAVNTAVHLLLDNSGSMGGHPLRVCQETAVVLDMAIQGTRTNVEITGFTGSAQHPVLYRYRAFGQKGQSASASLGNMDEVSLGGTPVSTPLLEAWRRLSQQKEPRRVLIVVSDGGADYNDVQAARAAHDFVVRQGCSVLGIAVGYDQSMRNWCDNVQAVESIDDLPIALTNLVREALK